MPAIDRQPATAFRQQYSMRRNLATAVSSRVKEIKSICLVKGQPKIIVLVKSQSKYLAGQMFHHAWMKIRVHDIIIGMPTLVPSKNV